MAATVSGRATVTASVSAATHMWLHWARVAIESAAEARAARAALIEAQGAGEEMPLDTELRPALVAIAASAHALDALYAELKPLVVPEQTAQAWERRSPRRRNQIHVTLQHGFRISAQEWKAEFDWLFDLRDNAVHPDFAFDDPYTAEPTHPLGVNVAREYRVFMSEAAERALAIVLDVARTCAERPKPLAAQWASDARGSVRALDA